LRAVVDNRPVGKQLSNRPFRSSGFFSEDAVTLFCQIEKNGGDWKRHYLMRPGVVEIEDVQDATDWLGPDTYKKRLANAGLSPAMAKVLALEQGETDKLCEYAPRQLLDLVFQVFGDKEVLDDYDNAKHHQRETEVELKRFETELEASKTNLEGLRLRVANFHSWEHHSKEKQNLEAEILPSLQYHDAREKAADISLKLRNEKKFLITQDTQLSEARNSLSKLATALSDATNTEAALEKEEATLLKQLGEVNGKLKPLESLLSQKDRLQKLAEDAGADIADAAAQLEIKEADSLALRQKRAAISERISSDKTTINALESKAALPEPDDVRAMRRALRDAGLDHVMLTDTVEVTDPLWQGAVEGVLRGYSSVILLEDASKASAAFRLGEQQRYKHFLVPERITAPVCKDQSLLSVLRFSAPVPAWLIDQLAKITRVESVDIGMHLSSKEEWITPEAYHRERRGGRSLFVEASRYRFGQAGRSQRLAALQKSMLKMESEEDQLTLTISKLAAECSALKSRLAGVDAAKELAARQAEFDEAAHAATPLKEKRTKTGTRLAELGPEKKKATETRTRADTAWNHTKSSLSDNEAQLRHNNKRHFADRSAHAQALLDTHKTWHHLPFNWRSASRRTALVAEHQNAHQVALRLSSLVADLARDDWESDGTVVDQYVRLKHQLEERENETGERRYQNNRAIEATTNARGAYIERLRYTIKTYGRNIKELGELAGIEVHTDTVRLENDDVQLSQAGLHVRFKFDGKGIIGMNDGEASGGQQVMKSLILLIGLLKSDEGAGGFVFIDEPFAHLDIRNIQLVGEFLKNTDAQYLMTTPLTHNTDVYDPSELTLITKKKDKDSAWAQPITVLQRRMAKVA
ncbi:MAG: chromosome segregation protein SMC, partial [Glaciimonas sp.]|nr:chromosome segregation protein SMC [Glaciimonas sp.]